MFWKLFKRRKINKDANENVTEKEKRRNKNSAENIRETENNKTLETPKKKASSETLDTSRGEIGSKRRSCERDQRKTPKETLTNTETLKKSPCNECSRCKSILKDVDNKFRCDEGKYVCRHCIEAFFSEKLNSQSQTTGNFLNLKQKIKRRKPKLKLKKIIYKNKPKKLRPKVLCQHDKSSAVLDQSSTNLLVNTKIDALSLSKIDVSFISESRNQNRSTTPNFSEEYEESNRGRKYEDSSTCSSGATFVVDNDLPKRKMKSRSGTGENFEDAARQILRRFDDEYVPSRYVKSCNSWYANCIDAPKSKFIKKISGFDKSKMVKRDANVCKKSCGHCYLCIKKEEARAKREKRRWNTLLTAYMISCKGKIN